MAGVGDLEEPEDGEPLRLADALVISSEGSVEPNFDVGRLTIEGYLSFEIIGVTSDGSRHLVAFPFSAWNRRAAHRRLPAGALVRAHAAEVSACKDAREEPSDTRTIKLWIGYLNPPLEAGVNFEPYGEACDHVFQDVAGSPATPHAVSLVNAVSEAFSFVSATSGDQAPAVAPLAEQSATDDHASRLVRVETALGSLQTTLTQLATRLEAPNSRLSVGPKAAASAPRAVSFGAAPAPLSPPPPGLSLQHYPALSPQTVAAARSWSARLQA